MIDPHTLHLAIQRLLTCAPSLPCGREEDCALVAMALRRLLPVTVADGGPELVLFTIEGNRPVHSVKFGPKGGVIVRSLP